jgi:hypothetical protein
MSKGLDAHPNLSITLIAQFADKIRDTNLKTIQRVVIVGGGEYDAAARVLHTCLEEAAIVQVESHDPWNFRHGKFLRHRDAGEETLFVDTTGLADLLWSLLPSRTEKLKIETETSHGCPLTMRFVLALVLVEALLREKGFKEPHLQDWWGPKYYNALRGDDRGDIGQS